jgi:soluble lytic murein transglycosylase-like protein
MKRRRVLGDSFFIRATHRLSIKSLPFKSIVKFLITLPLILFVCYLPVTYMAYKGYKERAVSAGYWDVVLLEFDPSMRGDIYRLIQTFPTGLTYKEEAQLAGLICAESQKYSCDPELVLALIIVESSFYSKATSSKGAKGLMQLRPPVAKALAQEVGIEWDEETTIYNPEVNLQLGLYYLSQLILQFKDLKVALAAYNFGPTYIKERIELGMPLPTEYADKVLRKYHRLSQERSKEQGQGEPL